MTTTVHQSPAAEHADVWAQLAAPIPPEKISWRQDGKPRARDDKYFARFVCYIEAGTVRERLDAVVPGDWNLTLELQPHMTTADDDGVDTSVAVAYKARLQILGVVREDVGQGKDYKQAATDAFKRAAVRFGIGHELYEMEQNWVRMDGDGKYAKPIEDPQEAYERRHGNGAAPEGGTRARPKVAHDVPPCPKCGGRMWDNRVGKRNPNAPDFKCRDRSCDGAIWPPKEKKEADPQPASSTTGSTAPTTKPAGPGAASSPTPNGTDAVTTRSEDVPLPIPNQPETGHLLGAIPTPRLEFYAERLRQNVADRKEHGGDTSAATLLLEQIGEVLATRATNADATRSASRGAKAKRTEKVAISMGDDEIPF